MRSIILTLLALNLSLTANADPRPSQPAVVDKIPNNVRRDQQDFDRAGELSTATNHKQQQTAAVHVRRGIAWYHQKQYDKALAELDKAIHLSPHDMDIYKRRGCLRMKMAKYDDAIADFSEILRRDQNNAEILTMRAYVWSVKQEFDRALVDYTQCLTLDPKDIKARYCRGTLLAQLKRVDEAIADYNQAIRIDPKNLNSPGIRGRLPKGEVVYEPGSLLAVQFASLYNNRGILWSRQGEYDRAIADFDTSIQRNPKHITAWYNRGNAWLHKREYAKAVLDFNRIITLDPTIVRPYRRLAMLFATCPDRKFRDARLALAYAKKGCELSDWKDHEMIDAFAAACAENGQFKDAVHWQSRAIELAPQNRTDSYRGKLVFYESGKRYWDEQLQSQYPWNVT